MAASLMRTPVEATDCGVFTIAAGAPIYFTYACALARSFVLHNAANAVSFTIYSDDAAADLPADLADAGVAVKQWSLPPGISAKLQLDELAPAKHSLFIDSDSLCFGAVETVFERFARHAVSVIGTEVTSGEWCGAEIRDVCDEFSLPAIYRFNGGLYYVAQDGQSSSIFDTARRLQREYDRLGFKRHRGWINEEPLVALALALHRETGVTDDGTVMTDLSCGAGNADLDVISGRAILRNPACDAPGHKPYRPRCYRPVIVHFCGPDASQFPYTREALKLRLLSRGKAKLIALLAAAGVTAYHRLQSVSKLLLRPVYHKVFGVRAVRASPRPFEPSSEAHLPNSRWKSEADSAKWRKEQS